LSFGLRPPLSVRKNPDALQDYMSLNDGIPEWMHSGVYSWAETFFYRSANNTWNVPALQQAEQVLRVPLDWRNTSRAAASLLELLHHQGGLDLLDYCLGKLPDESLRRHSRSVKVPPPPPARKRNHCWRSLKVLRPDH